MDVGFWSVVPPILTIVLAIATKEVLMSLFVGVFVGCLIIGHWNPFTALQTMISMIVDSLGDPWNIQVLIVIVLLGGLIGLMIRSGGSAAFGTMLRKRIHTKNGAQLMTWFIGLLIFFDDYFNALTNGAIMRPVADEFNISREKTSYIIDSTAVGVCLLSPLSSWVAFTCSLIGEGFKTSGIQIDAFTGFLSTIPYNFYCWLSIIMVFFVAKFKLDFGPMAKAEKRTEETGKLCDKTFSGGDSDADDFSAIEVVKGKARALILPILVLVISAMILMLYTGGFFKSYDLLDAVNKMDGMLALTYSCLISVVFAIIYYAVVRLSTISESVNAFVIGAKALMFVLILIVFAWAIGGVGDALDTAGYIASLFVGNVPALVVPLIIFIFSCFMTFSTGAAWGTYGIMMPLAIPLAVAMNLNPVICIAAVIGGGAFGTHCSPIADTAILSSAAANVRHTDHIKTQIPYSVTCALCAAAGYLVAGIIQSWFLAFGISLAVFLLAIFLIPKMFNANKNNQEFKRTAN